MKHITLQDSDYSAPVFVTEDGVIDSDETRIALKSIMRTIDRDRRIEDLLISPESIQKRIEGLAREIDETFPTGTIEMLPILNGCFLFAPDLARTLYRVSGREMMFHMAKLSTYGDEIKGDGEVLRQVKAHLDPGDLQGKDILVIEDIVDQGFTLQFLLQMLEVEKKVNSIHICSLLVKDLEAPADEVASLRESIPVDYTGFHIPDLWVAGYGIDACGELRHLPYIITVNKTQFR